MWDRSARNVIRSNRLCIHHCTDLGHYFGRCRLLHPCHCRIGSLPSSCTRLHLLLRIALRRLHIRQLRQDRIRNLLRCNLLSHCSSIRSLRLTQSCQTTARQRQKLPRFRAEYSSHDRTLDTRLRLQESPLRSAQRSTNSSSSMCSPPPYVIANTMSN